MPRVPTRLWVTLLVAASASIVVACSGDDRPPILDNGDGGTVPKTDGGTTEPCQSDAPGCPCKDAGAEQYCGVIYRVVGNHVDCAKGYMKCGDDGNWGKCEGPTVYGAE